MGSLRSLCFSSKIARDAQCTYTIMGRKEPRNLEDILTGGSVMALLLGIAFLVTVVLVDNDVVEVKRA